MSRHLMSDLFLLVKPNDPVCDDVIQDIEHAGLPVKVVDVEKNGFRALLWRDFRTYNLPILVNSTRFYSGRDQIQQYIRSVKIVRVVLLTIGRYCAMAVCAERFGSESSIYLALRF